MYASSDNESSLSSPQNAFRRRFRSGQTLKCFILTPNAHYINPTFLELSRSSNDKLSAPMSLSLSSFDTITVRSGDSNGSPFSTTTFTAFGPSSWAHQRDVSPATIISDSTPSTHASSPLPSIMSNLMLPTNLDETNEPSATTPLTMASPTGSSPTSLVYRQGLGMSPVLFGSPQSDVPRYDSSLASLTKKFVSILMSSPEQGIDLSEAAQEMGVAKRRLYDVSNVLEGVGITVKFGKNRSKLNPDLSGLSNIRVTSPEDNESDQIGSPPRLMKTTAVDPNVARTEGLQRAIVALRQEERQLDEYIDLLVAMVKRFAPRAQEPKSSEASQAQSPSKADNFFEDMFVTYDDLLSLGSYGSDTVIAARAPSGTTVEVPDPDQGMRPGTRQFKLYLDSQGAQQDNDRKADKQPIEVFLVQYFGADLNQPATSANVAASTAAALPSESSARVPLSSEARATYPHSSQPSGVDVLKKPYIDYGPRLSSPYADAQMTTDRTQRRPHLSTDTRTFASGAPGSTLLATYGRSDGNLYGNVPSQQPYLSSMYPSMGQPPPAPPPHLQAYPYAVPGSYDGAAWQHWPPMRESRLPRSGLSQPDIPWAPPVSKMPRNRGPRSTGVTSEARLRGESRNRATAAQTSRPPAAGASASRKRASPGASPREVSARKARKPRSLRLEPRADPEASREPSSDLFSQTFGGGLESNVPASALLSGAASPSMRSRDYPHDDTSTDTGAPLTPRALTANLTASSGMSPMNFHFDLLDIPLQSPTGRLMPLQSPTGTSYGATSRPVPSLGSPIFPSSLHQGPWHGSQTAPYPLPGLPNDLSPDVIFPGNNDDTRWALLPQGSNNDVDVEHEERGDDGGDNAKQRDDRRV
jgi:hypothetical protein